MLQILLGILAGVLVGVVAMTPVIRHLVRRAETRAESRAREAERRARENERLAELGSMTGGLAHEIKNPLSTIGLNAQLLVEGLQDADLPEDQRERLGRRLDALAREAERLKGILTDFLQFAGRVKLDPQPHDLNQLVDELRDFYHPQCDQAGVVLRTRVPKEPITIRVDAALLKQAILNLMINAIQAMLDARPRAKLDPSAEDAAHLDELMLRVEADEEEARIHVIDTGPGIEEEKLDEIFLPYVTHKTAGTGLGLPTARRIVEEHGGRLAVNSEPGRGSDFVVHLPR